MFNLNSKESSRNTLRMSNSLDRDQAQHFVGPDLGPNCLQMLSADGTSRQRIIKGYFSIFHGMYLVNDFNQSIFRLIVYIMVADIICAVKDILL